MEPEGAAGPADILNSWKEIAAYLERDVRTVMRWERTRGLPVHRLPGGPKSAVYGRKAELEEWRKARLTVVALRPEFSSSQHRPDRALVLLASGCLVLTVAGAMVALWPSHRHFASPLPLAMTRLTYARMATWPAISADGKLLAYAADREGKFDIYVQQIGGHQPLRVTRNEADNFQPALSPDGSLIAFRSERDGGGLYLVETFGGIERRIADGGFPAFSPDGSTISYLVRNAFTGRAKMFLVPAAGGPGRRFQPEFEVPPAGPAFSLPMWSPEGRHILFEGARGSAENTRGLWVAPAGGGAAAPVRNPPSLPPGAIRTYMAWTGNYLYYVEGTTVQGMPLIRAPIAAHPWRFAGVPVRLTSSSTVCGAARVAASGRLVMMVATFLNNIWSAPLDMERPGVAGPLRQETSDAENKLAMSLASDGSRLAYTSVLEVGHMELRLIDLPSRHPTVLPLSSQSLTFPRLNPDGSRLSYCDEAAAKRVCYSISASGPGSADPACRGCQVLGFFSGSGDLLVSDGSHLYRQDEPTQTRTVLIDSPAADPGLSPDDRWLAFAAPKPDGAAVLFIAPVGNRAVPASEWLAVAADRNFIGSPRWSPSGRYLFYLSNRDGSPCVWAQRFDPLTKALGAPIHVYHDHGFPSLRANPVRTFAVTADRLYLMMAEMSSNVWTATLDLP